MDSSKLVKSFTDAWGSRKKIEKRDKGTPIVRKSDDDKLIYEVQCNRCHTKIKTLPRSGSTTSFRWNNFDVHACNLVSNETLVGVVDRSSLRASTVALRSVPPKYESTNHKKTKTDENLWISCCLYVPSPDSTIVDDPDQSKEKETIYNVNRFEILTSTMVKDNAEEFMAASIISVVEMTKNTDSKYKGTYVMNPDHFTHAISQLELMREEVTDKKTAAKNVKERESWPMKRRRKRAKKPTINIRPHVGTELRG
jgi:hypothetical protein